MAFVHIDSDTTMSDRQRLSLSQHAYNTVMNDMDAFWHRKNISGFVNHIFSNYYQSSEASIAFILKVKEYEINNTLAAIPKSQREGIVKKLIGAEEAKLKNKIEEKKNSYEKSGSISFVLNKENSDYLGSDECGENKYYKTRSGRREYIECVIEEYARLAFVERERIVFSETIKVIEEAIQRKKQLRLETDTKKTFCVYPHKILCDPLSTANYLVGYSYLAEEDPAEKKPASFRISAIQKIQMKSISAFLKESEWKKLEKEISSRGVQFMIGNAEKKIKVRLTETGQYKYRRQVALRPITSKQQDDIYEFDCTTAQAEFYFFKFGKDAEILEPSELREKMKTMYNDAADVYNEKE